MREVTLIGRLGSHKTEPRLTSLRSAPLTVSTIWSPAKQDPVELSLMAIS
jgi:hypothetical protein